MNELLVTLPVLLAGSLVAIPVLPALGRWGHAAVTVPAGFALYLCVATVLIAAGAFSVTLTLVAAVGVGAAVAATWWVATGRPQVRPGDVLASGGAVVVAVSTAVAVFGAANMARLTPDSGEYLVIASSLERWGSIEGLGGGLALIRLIGVPLLHAPGADGLGYMATWTPILGLAGIGLTAWLGNRALASDVLGNRGLAVPWRVVIVGIFVLFVLTTNRVLYNLFYINGHLVFATFLLLGVGLAWLGATTRQWTLLVPASIGFATLPILRPEGVVVALLFLVPLVVDERFTPSGRWLVFAPTAVTTVVWHGLTLVPNLTEAHLDLTGPVLSNLVGVAGVAVLIVLAGVPALRRWVPLAVPAMVGLIAAYVFAQAWDDWDSFNAAVTSTVTNLTHDGLWSTFWWIAPVLFLLAAVVTSVPMARTLVYPLASWPLALLLFSFLREGDGYRVGPGDSGNRMMMHIALVLVFYLMLATGTAARQLEPPRALPSRPAGDPVEVGVEQVQSP